MPGVVGFAGLVVKIGNYLDILQDYIYTYILYCMYDVWILIQAILEPDDQSFPVLEKRVFLLRLNARHTLRMVCVKTPAVKPCSVHIIVLLCSVGSKELSA